MMLIAAGVFTVSTTVLMLNFKKIARDPLRLLDGDDNTTMVHAAMGVISGLSLLALLGGFVWFLILQASGH